MSASRVACFGKLPFHREFLRVNLGSPAATWVERWVEGAHAAWTREGRVPEATPVARFAATAGQRLVAGVVRQSGDGLRRHPVALFVEAPAVASDRWHLVPLACAPTWAALAETLARPMADVPELTAALDAGVPGPAVALAEAAYGRLGERSGPRGPWQALTGTVDGDAAREIGRNLVAVATAQREAAEAAEGVGVAFPLAAGAADAEALAGLWLEVFAAACARPLPPPTVLLTGEPPRLVAVYRPADGRDLAAVLSSLAMAPIDDLAEPWGGTPDPGAAAAIEALVAETPAPLGALPARARAAGGA